MYVRHYACVSSAFTLHLWTGKNSFRAPVVPVSSLIGQFLDFIMTLVRTLPRLCNVEWWNACQMWEEESPRIVRQAFVSAVAWRIEENHHKPESKWLAYGLILDSGPPEYGTGRPIPALRFWVSDVRLFNACKIHLPCQSVPRNVLCNAVLKYGR